MTEFNDSNIQNLWQQQPTENSAMSITEIRSKANAFQTRIRIRNTVEYVAAIMVVISFANLFLIRLKAGDVIGAVGCVFTILAAFFITYYLHKNGHASSPPIDGDMRTYLSYLISDGLRQRDLLQNIFWWYLTPCIPGFLLLLIGGFRVPSQKEGPVIRALTMLVILLTVFIGVYKLNQRAAAKIQAGIDSTEAALKALNSSKV